MKRIGIVKFALRGIRRMVTIRLARARFAITVLLVLSLVGLPSIQQARATSSSPGASVTPKVDAAVGRIADRISVAPGVNPRKGAKTIAGGESAGIPFKSLPVRFEMNAGQTDPQVRFIASTPSGDMFLTPNELVMRVFEPSRPPDKKERRANPVRRPPNSEVVRLHTVNANPDVRIVGIDPLPGMTNYFLGNDPKKWHTNVQSFARVRYENIYPGIDLIYYGNEGNLEYDFDVAPGADPKQIALSVEGGDGAVIDQDGNLVLRTSVGSVIQHAPRIYQQDRAGRHEIAGGYVLRRDGRVAFDLESYDRGETLVIDPEVVYSTYFGGSAGTAIDGLAVDANGSVYVAGDTYAHDFPTQNPLQGTNNHSQNYSAFISKFSPDGQSLVYSTYLGGSGSGSDFGIAMTLDSTNAAYITGITNSIDFPTQNAFQPTFGGGSENVFVAKISPAGSTLVYSSYLGGNGIDVPYAISLNSTGSAYLCGSTTSTNFPTMNPTQASLGGVSMLGFFSIIGPDGSQLGFSSYIGTGGPTYLQSQIVIQATGDAFCSQASVPDSATSTSRRESDTWPASGGSFESRLRPGQADDMCRIYYYHIEPEDTFPLNPEKAVVISEGSDPFPCNSSDGGDTFANTQPDDDDLSIIYVLSPLSDLTPFVTSSDGTAGTAYAAIMHMDPTTGNILSTQNITVPIEPPSGVASDSQGAVYLTGSQPTSPAFPLVNPVQPAGGGGIDAYLAVFAPGTAQLVFSTYIGGSGDDESAGIALDPQGNMYIAGTTTSPDFPTKNAYQATPPAPNGIMVGQGNSFIVKISSLGTIASGPDFSLALGQPSVTTTTGTKVPVTVNIDRLGGLTGKITISPPTGLPDGIKLAAKPESTAANSLTFTIKVKKTAQAGTYPLVFTGTDSSGQTHTATLTLTVAD